MCSKNIEETNLIGLALERFRDFIVVVVESLLPAELCPS